MVSNHYVRFRVNQKQLEQIKFISEMKGHNTPSSYLREISLRGDSFIENKLIAISRDVKEVLERLK